MPRVLPKRARWKDEDLVVAWTSIASGDYVIVRGTRLQGNHPVVKACPAYFVADGTPDDQIPTDFAYVGDPTQHVPQVTVAPTIPNEEAVVCHTRFYVMATGRLVGKGAVLRRDDPVVKAHPEYFRTAGVAP